ncbi:MAG: substrate-binding periplasmic protein [Bdellovibrionales bacterium]
MKTLLTILLAVGLALFLQNTQIENKSAPFASTQPAYDRVIKTNTLRCAYALYPPFISKDPNTGKLYGYMVDLMDRVGQLADLKIEWAEEIDFSVIAATLQTGRADAFCSGLAITPTRGRMLAGSVPVSLGPIETYARKDDTRFDNDPEKINDPSVKVEVNAGDLSEHIAKRFFPKATLVYRGTVGGEDQLFLDVAMKKADVTISGPSNLSMFNQNNGANALRKVPFDRPLYLLSGAVAVEIHEAALLSLLNTALQDLIDNGEIKALMKKNMGADYGTAYLPPKSRI